ncbi:MAG: ankyrin repeat domain-containing protein [Acidobacteriia bacterium]|nr:ankyrin repeat domain-containing protein [Terriglobia bacterium]
MRCKVGIALVVLMPLGLFGQSPITLIDASRVGDWDEVKRLMDEGVSIDARDDSKWGYSALHWAIRAKDAERTARLLALGANPDVRAAWDSETPLHVASAQCNLEGTLLLLAARAAINARDDDDWTPLHFAINSRCSFVVTALIDGGADLNARYSRDKSSSAINLAKRRSSYIFDLLKDAGAR